MSCEQLSSANVISKSRARRRPSMAATATALNPTWIDKRAYKSVLSSDLIEWMWFRPTSVSGNEQIL